MENGLRMSLLTFYEVSEPIDDGVAHTVYRATLSHLGENSSMIELTTRREWSTGKSEPMVCSIGSPEWMKIHSYLASNKIIR